MFGKRQIRRSLILLSAVLLFCAATAGAEERSFSVKRIGQIVSFKKNAFSVDAPEAGRLIITVRDDFSVFRILEQDIAEGNTVIEWDGCGYNHEKLIFQTYHIEAELEGLSGKIYSVLFDSPVEYSGQRLEFALPSGPAADLSNPDEWVLEAKTNQSGTLLIDFYPEGEQEPVLSVKKAVSAGKIFRASFSQLTGKKSPGEGSFHVEVREASKPDEVISFSLQVCGSTDPMPELAVTGGIMPERGADDAEIWEAMMQPATVVDIDYTDHQNVYETPETEGKILGTLHGQTQCLAVLEIREEWVRIGAWNHEEAEYIEGWVPRKRLKTVIPQTEYGLLLDKQKQTLTVFQNGKRLETLLVSTGRMEAGEYYQETAAGSFLTGLHRVDYSTQGQKYDFVIQYDGGNLLHQIPYAWGGKKDFTQGRALLGAKGSHACIRIQSDPGPENGINAYWLWTHIPYHTRLLILDDPEERRSEKAILAGTTPGFEDLAGLNMTTTEDASAVTITFCGDAVIGGREAYYSLPNSMMAILSQYGMAYPFEKIKDITGQDDLTCVNLECVLKATKEDENKKKEWRFRGLPEYTEVLTEGSVELVSLANNHTIDYGESGYQSTVEAIDEKLSWCGKDHVCIMNIKGHVFGFGSCRETSYLEDPDVIRKDIAQMKENGCEVIIYQCHWGTEYDAHHNGLQESMARACARAGADLVVGHHPHVVQGMDWIGDMPVIYSLGNLTFGGTIDLKTYDALMVQVQFRFGGDKKPPQIRLIPILTSSAANEKINNFQPVIAQGEDRTRILTAIQADTAFPLTEYTGQ